MDLRERTFAYYLPTINLMGVGASAHTAKQIKSLGGTRVLLVTDKGLVATGIAVQIQQQLKDAGIEVLLFDKVQPNPTDLNVHDGLKAYQENHCDCIVSLGGGSVHDCAKGIGIVTANGGDIRDFEGVDKSFKPMPPLVAVNTTAGTGSEVTRFCIITDTQRHVKMAIVDWHVTPTVAVNDPLLMVGMPASLTAATGMDALTHAVEAYVSTAATPLTDSAAIAAIKLIANNLRNAVANGQNMQARDNMAYAEFLAGMAFNNASLGYVHAMAHQLGGFYNLPHGVCNALLLPHIENYNIIANPRRFADIAVAMGENIASHSVRSAADMAIKAIKQLSADINIPSGLKELGVKEEDLETMSQNAMKDACALTNPRNLKLTEVIELYRRAL